MMGLIASNTGQWKEGVARLELPCVWNLNSERIIMINNSSLNKWHRLGHKQLNQQFVHEIIHGMNCSSLRLQQSLIRFIAFIVPILRRAER